MRASVSERRASISVRRSRVAVGCLWVAASLAAPSLSSPQQDPAAEPSSGGASRLLDRVSAWLDAYALPDAPEGAVLDSEVAESLVDELAARARRVTWVGYLGASESSGWLGQAKRWLVPRSPDLAAIDSLVYPALARAFEVEPLVDPPGAIAAAVASLRGGAADPDTIARVNAALDVDALFVAVADPLPGSGALRLDARLLAGRSRAGARAESTRVVLDGASFRLGRWNPRALALYGTLALLGMLRVLRGWGTLVVRLDQPTGEQHAAWTIHVSSAQSRRGRGGKARSRRGTSRSKHLAGKLSTFSRLPPRLYVVRVQRVYRDPETHEVTHSQEQQKSVALRGWRTTQLRFELAEQIPLEIELLRDGQPLAEDSALAAFRGRPDSLRYLRGGRTLLHAERGEHGVLLGIDDCVFERRVSLESAGRKQTLRFDASRRDKALLAGCPAAVEPYVLGDLEASIRALEEAGDERAANLLRAELHRARGDTGEVARLLAAAGKVREAAELSESSSDAARTAALYERAGERAKAALHYRSAGDLEAALRNYEALCDWEGAVDCALKLGDRSRAIGFLEKRGHHLDAARMALETDDEEHAIRCLQRVAFRDESYGEACVLLAELFTRRDELELALQKLDEAANVFGNDAALALRERIGNRLEERGEIAGALEVFETIRKRDINHPGTAEKIEQLREALRTRPSIAAADATSDAGDSSEVREGRYEILEEIGRGAMGIVYKARDRRLERIVALKRLPENLKEHPTAVRLFLREARSAAALNHPNVVTLFDAGQSDGVYYLTMEHLEGMPVDAILERGKLSVRDALGLSVQVAMGLEYAHGQRIVHRDIKPSNLFYTRSRKAKIMDFGLAKMIEEVRRASSVIAGTPYYMAPEQAMGEAVDHRADLYAFGVTVFRLVTGRLPFESGDVTYHHCHTPPPDPRELCLEIPEALAALILRLLAKRPEDRFETTGEVKRGLVAVLRSLQG